MATFVRRDAWSSDGATALSWYARAVGRMQTLDAENPLSWAYQAAMHGTYSTGDGRLPPGWNSCEHGTWYFVAWHRMYVLYFEQIVRSMVVSLGGPTDWALPYWNYTPADLGNPSIPDAFRDPRSPLYVWERRVTPYNVNAGARLPDSVTAIASTMATPSFLVGPMVHPAMGFGGQVTSPIHLNSGFGALERQPHNVVHDAVGGTYGWMADVNFAAQDPIFWLHHSNIDRLWASWNRLRPNTSLEWWAQQEFTFFTGDGTQVTRKVGDVQSIVALGYQYDRLATLPAQGGAEPPDEPAVPEPADVPVAADVPVPQRAEMVGASEQPLRLTGRRAAHHVAIDERAHAGALDAVGGGPRVLLALDDIEAERNPGTVYEVYVNLPDGATAEQAADHLAGALSFFGIDARGRRADGSDHLHAYRAGYDITDLVARLRERGLWDARDVTVTFHEAGVPFGEDQPVTRNLPTVTVGRISVHYVG